MMMLKSVGHEAPEAAAHALPPHNLELEQAVLGAILVRNESLDRVADLLEPFHFFDPLHAQIFDVARQVINSGRLVSALTLRPYFEKAEPVGELTVPQYLGRLSVNATTTNNVYEYARAIRDLATRRELVLIGQDIITAAVEAHVDFPPSEQVEEAEMRLFALAERGEQGKEIDLSQAMATAVDEIEEIHKGDKTGLSTGIVDLDGLIGRLQPTDLLVLAGRPGMGKSALATNIARAVASENYDKNGVVIPGSAVAFYSLEMSSTQIASRLLGEGVEISSSLMRKGSLTDDQIKTIRERGPGIGKLPIIVDDTGAISIAQLAARARRLKRKRNIGLVIVDYLQLMAAGKGSGGNRVQDLTTITTGLKALAKELRVPVIALSQLSRAVENRDNKRPQLSDLRESGSIEQDADIVMFVYREEYYVRREEPSKHDVGAYADWNKKLMECAGKAEIIVAKQRHGSTGTASVQFSKELMRFADLAKEAR